MLLFAILTENFSREDTAKRMLAKLGVPFNLIKIELLLVALCLEPNSQSIDTDHNEIQQYLQEPTSTNKYIRRYHFANHGKDDRYYVMQEHAVTPFTEH